MGVAPYCLAVFQLCAHPGVFAGFDTIVGREVCLLLSCRCSAALMMLFIVLFQKRTSGYVLQTER